MAGSVTGADLGELGRAVREARRSMQITLEELAKSSGVSKSVLSQVERGTTNPTLSTLWNIASALSLDPLDLIGWRSSARVPQAPDGHVELVDDPAIENREKKYRLVILSKPELAGTTELYHLHLQAGGALESRPHEAGTVEQLTVLRGQVEVRSGTRSARLRTGGTARYAADVVHSITATGGRGADAIIFVVFS